MVNLRNKVKDIRESINILNKKKLTVFVISMFFLTIAFVLIIFLQSFIYDQFGYLLSTDLKILLYTFAIVVAIVYANVFIIQISKIKEFNQYIKSGRLIKINIKNKNAEDKITLASNLNTLIEILKELAKENNIEIQIALADNEKLLKTKRAA